MSESQMGKEAKVGAFQIAILILSVVILCALAADTVFDLPVEVRRLIQAVDTAVCVVLLTDFCARFYRAESKRVFMKWGWIDLVASVPNLDLFRWGRLVRVLRVIRLLRGIRSLHRVLTMVFQNKMKGGAVSLALMAFLLITFSSVSILVCERQADSNIKSAEDAVWWSFATMTTVGYGDIYPVTTEGRVVGVILMICGVGMFAGLSGLVASVFLGAQDGKSFETREILARLERMQSQLDLLRQQRATTAERDISR